jgi:hypothetical protein
MTRAPATAPLRGDRARNHFVDIAPDPVFSGLDRTDQGMAALVKMLGGVFILRRIAATDVPAYHAHAQMDPGVAHFHALFTDVSVSGRELDLIQMLAFL